MNSKSSKYDGKDPVIKTVVRIIGELPLENGDTVASALQFKDYVLVFTSYGRIYQLRTRTITSYRDWSLGEFEVRDLSHSE